MNKNVRLTVLGLVFVLSTVFFWEAINGYLMPSRAQVASNMRVFISDKAIQCNTSMDALCLVHIFGSTDNGVGVAGVTGAIDFSNSLVLAGITQQGFCGQAAFNLDAVLKYRPAPPRLSFSLAALRGDNQLISGNKCITTVGFKRNPADSATPEAKVMLAEADKWQAVGSQNLAPQVDTTPVVISFSADAPIPTITITPPVDQPGVPTPPTSPGASCATKAKGDCSCDGKVTV